MREERRRINEIDVAVGRREARIGKAERAVRVVALGAHVEVVEREAPAMELAEEAVAPVDVPREHVEARVARDVRHREIAWRRRTREIVVDAFDQDAAMHRPRKRLDGARAKAMTPP